MCHNQKCATVIGSSQLVRALKLRRPNENPPNSAKLDSFQSTPADCRAWKVSSIKKSDLSRSFLAFMGKDSTDQCRPYTPGMSSRSTPQDSGNRQHQRSIPRSRCLSEQRGTRRCRRTSHRRGIPRRRPGLQRPTPMTGPLPLKYQVSTLRFSIRTRNRTSPVRLEADVV